MITTHRNQDVNELLAAFRGRIIFDLLYLPPEPVMRSGYETLRKLVIWYEDTQGKVSPENLQVVMRWLRDHFGPEEAKLAAVARHAADVTSQPTDRKTSTGSNSSGTAT